MLRRMSVLAALSAAMGCSTGAADPATNLTAAPEAFVGAWRSVTPSTEFIRLTINPTAGPATRLGARLTFSGVALDGLGQIEGDSAVLTLSSSPLSSKMNMYVLRASDANHLTLQERPATTGGLRLTLEREP